MKVGCHQTADTPSQTWPREIEIPKPIRTDKGTTMKTKLVALVSETLARAVYKLAPSVPAPNGSGEDPGHTAPDEKVPRDRPGHAALFADYLGKPVWALLRVEDVIR